MVRLVAIAALVLAMTGVAQAEQDQAPLFQRPQAESQQRFGKVADCKFRQAELIGLTRDQLREKCGLWSEAHDTTNAAGQSEQLVYVDYAMGPMIYVYLERGVVKTISTR